MSMTSCRTLLLVTVLALAGCTVYWSKPGSTLAEFQRDSYECRYAGAALPYAPVTTPTAPPNYGTASSGWAANANALSALSAQLADRAMRERMSDECMVARGWTKD
jgi:hypothetical protein